MNDENTVTIDKDFYNELTNNYYNPPKPSNETPTGLAIIITILIIAIIILGVWCFVLDSRLKEVENVLEQANMLLRQVEMLFN